MLPNELARYKPLFLQTAWDYIRQLENSLHVLSTDPTDKTAIASVHLCSHSLKSQCSVMQFHELSEICKQIELNFKIIKDDGGPLSPEEIVKLQQVVEGIKESLAEISTGDNEKDMSEERKTLGILEAKGDSV